MELALGPPPPTPPPPPPGPLGAMHTRRSRVARGYSEGACSPVLHPEPQGGLSVLR